MKKLNKLIKIFKLLVPSSLILLNSCSFLNHNPDHYVFKRLKQKYWHKDIIDIQNDWVNSEKRFINIYNTNNYVENMYSKDEYAFMNSYRYDSRKIWNNWNTEEDGEPDEDFLNTKFLAYFLTYKGIENIRGYDLFYIKKGSILFNNIKKYFNNSNNFILLKKFMYVNSIDEPLKQYIGIRDYKLEDNKFFINTYKQNSYEWNNFSFRRQHENLNINVIKKYLYERKNDFNIQYIHIWRKLEQYLVIPTDVSLEKFNLIKEIRIV
ncbi:hypothetical protein [Mycoplasma leonicaptivi]|uniref:hypothetical protein n=1 Tax=Mycoplasma leonicaptivi TaxID=36742 RepID=UPI000484EBD9|nr:hypothetical protein [Mycoplasma leonicaptivi]